jgi:acetyltransferase-like isoleucine patch superfamily enzyme
MKLIKSILRLIYYLRSYSSFKKRGKNIILSKGGVFIRPDEITIGSNVFISNNFHISARNLTIGNNVIIGPNLVIECDNHVFSHIGKNMFETRNERKIGFVTIEDDVWIGANVTILPNSKIQEGTIIGAGSIVNKVLPPYSICVGTPCKPIKTRFNKKELEEHLSRINSNYKFQDVIHLWKEYKLIQ